MTAYSFVDQKVEIVLLLAVDRGGGGKGEAEREVRVSTLNGGMMTGKDRAG